MYNLLVQYMPWEGGTGTVSAGRLFEHTDDTLENQFKNGDTVLFDEMMRMPCCSCKKADKMGLRA